MKKLTFPDRPPEAREWGAYTAYLQSGRTNMHALIEFIYLRANEVVSHDDLYRMDINVLVEYGNEAVRTMKIGDFFSMLSLAWEKEGRNAEADASFADELEHWRRATNRGDLTGEQLVTFAIEWEERKQQAAEQEPPRTIKPKPAQTEPANVPVNPPQGRNETLERWRRQTEHNEDVEEDGDDV